MAVAMAVRHEVPWLLPVLTLNVSVLTTFSAKRNLTAEQFCRCYQSPGRGRKRTCTHSNISQKMCVHLSAYVASIHKEMLVKMVSPFDLLRSQAVKLQCILGAGGALWGLSSQGPSSGHVSLVLRARFHQGTEAYVSLS